MIYMPSEKTDHNLKINLQSAIEYECRHLFSTYGYEIKNISCALSHEQYSYRIKVAIFNSRHCEKNFTFQREISCAELDKNFAYCHYNSDEPLINSSSRLFEYYFRAIANDIRCELEKITKDMPSVHTGIYDIDKMSIASASNYTTKLYTKEISLPEKIVNDYNAVSPKKKSKFEHIDGLIISSKTRLMGGYADPHFAFKYF